MLLSLGETITEEHFRGTFKFPSDLDFIGDRVKVDFFVGIFNNLIDKRIKENEINN